MKCLAFAQKYIKKTGLLPDIKASCGQTNAAADGVGLPLSHCLTASVPRLSL